MDLQHIGTAVAVILWPLELVACFLALRRRLWGFLPWFLIYLILLVVTNAGRWAVFLTAGYGSRTYSWVYWMTQPVHLLARGAALADVCRASLRPYAGV